MRRSVSIAITALVLVSTFVLEERGYAGGHRNPTPRPPSALVGPVKDSALSDEEKVEGYIELSARSLDKRVQSALKKIDGTPRRLLALRYYTERKSIKGTWAWTNKEMAAYRRSMDFRTANAEVDKVISLFQRTYPGLQLRTSKLARSLEDQIQLWNKTASVKLASANLMKQVTKALKTASYPDTATRASLAKFQTLLRKHSVRPIPTVAVPGLSHHGQLRAYDFVIWQGDKILAGTDGASIRNQWIGGRWGEKLRHVVYSASNRFEGPLKSPNEPWHFTYIR